MPSSADFRQTIFGSHKGDILNLPSLCKDRLARNKVRILLLCIIIAACSVPLSLLKAAKIGSGTNHALIVGINGYSQWPALKSPVKDAHRIADTLAKKYNFSKSNITLLTDKTKDKPTLINILLIFFAGQSFEDDEGETYWIPIDGKKKSKLTWLKHSTIISEYLGSKDFKAKSLLILADSHFSSKLVRSRSISLTPYDLRYPEKIMEKASRRSREVIAFSDQHWPGSASTDNFGLFTFYLDKALNENELEIIDFENLIFDENIFLPIQKIAGVRLVQGRLRKTKMDKGGQFIIARLAPAILIDVIESTVSPEKGYPGDPYTVTARTSTAASEVYFNVNNKKQLMQGSGTEWTFKGTFDSVGTAAFTIAALNRNEQSGKTSAGSLTAIKKRAEAANVLTASVTPSTGGFGGDNFSFAAKTDRPARTVALRIDKKRYAMRGSGTAWNLDQVVDNIGRVPFSIIATNEDGVQGRSGEGTLQTKVGPANVLAAVASPKTGYAGEEFLLKATTDRPAKTVSVEIDGQVFPMKGSGKDWQLKKAIPDIGKKSFTITAINPLGVSGRSGQGTLTAKKSPLPIPDVLAVDVSVVAPGKGYPGDRFTIQAKTSAPSDKVFLEIGGKQFTMQGSQTNWTYIARADQRTSWVRTPTA